MQRWGTDRTRRRPTGRRRSSALILVGVAVLAVACRPVAPSAGRLASGASLVAGQQVTSPAGAYRLAMQADGNVVVETSAGVDLWSTRTAGNAGATLVMRADGLLLVRSAAGASLWSSRTFGAAGATVALGDDANLVVSGTAGQPLWASGVSRVTNARLPVAQRRTSSHQVVLTKLYEGYVAAAPYHDSRGNCTVGYGHLIRPGACTAADRQRSWDADSLFAADVTEHERRLKASLGSLPVTQREFDALFDYVFNRGSLTASTSPGIHAALTASPPRYGDVVTLLRANGDLQVRGLCDRRHDEADLFAGGSYDRTARC